MFRIRLKELRENSGLSQYKLAEELKISQSAVGNWESGQREPNFSTVVKLANYFSVSVDYLLGHSDKPGFSPEEQAFGFSETKKEAVTPLEDDLLYEFRELGKSKGEQFQKAVIAYIQQLRSI